MAATPCSALQAAQILATAAEGAHVTPGQAAAAMIAGSRGATVPTHLERSLRRAIGNARTPSLAAARVALLPSRRRTEEVLAEFRRCRSRLAASPPDEAARRAVDDAAYTLCVMLGRTSVHDAVLAAEQHLASPA
ncbi:DUF5133 domain-containing protein [Streptomyces sp. NPDC048428]|uniref:DUF5133 domain-containing protein n=1 Tax=Streptomyces sp. NPDC048428 TaxID=3154503 RepID=UPI003446B716